MRTVRSVSLNRCEQLLFEYVERSPEERQYWLHKVRILAELYPSAHVAAERLEAELWRYFVERAPVVASLREFTKSEGKARTSMRNLAEYLLRLWGPVRVKKTPSQPGQEIQ